VLHRRFFATKISAVGFFWKLQRAIRRLQPDLIHSNALKANLCLSAIPLRGCPVLWHIHDFYSHRPQVKRLVGLASRRATACVAISKSIADDIQAVAPRLPVLLLENGVDTDHYKPGNGDPNALDRAAGFSESTSATRVGLVAAYANWKGHDVFLQAIARIPHVRGFIIGGPLYTTAGSQWTESELRARAEELGISDRVGFIPFQSDPCWIYRSLDVVVHASTRPEPFGLTIAEAMACGRPVVVSASGGAKDLFTDRWDAIGHESGNVVSLVNAIEQFAQDAHLRQEIGDRARQTAVERFSTARFGKVLVDIYESVLGVARP
jgi:glycosyltransferase involved in cell wall biosynthesis